MILEILLGLLIVIFITESYVIWNLLNKVELLETWVEDFSDRVAGTWEEIKTIDSTGHFEADDEVGTIFTSIKQTIEELTVIEGHEEGMAEPQYPPPFPTPLHGITTKISHTHSGSSRHHNGRDRIPP